MNRKSCIYFGVGFLAASAVIWHRKRSRDRARRVAADAIPGNRPGAVRGAPDAGTVEANVGLSGVSLGDDDGAMGQSPTSTGVLGLGSLFVPPSN